MDSRAPAIRLFFESWLLRHTVKDLEEQSLSVNFFVIRSKMGHCVMEVMLFDTGRLFMRVGTFIPLVKNAYGIRGKLIIVCHRFLFEGGFSLRIFPASSRLSLSFMLRGVPPIFLHSSVDLGRVPSIVL